MRFPTSAVLKSLSLLPLFLLLLLTPWRQVDAAQVYRTGNPADVNAPVTQAVCLAGGENKNLWHQAWKYLLERSGGGDVVVLRIDGERGDYENWIYRDEGQHDFPRVNSVTTIVLESAADAALPELENLVLRSELVFFAGGDQSLYVDYLRGSRLLSAIEQVMHRKGVPVAGTSAGMAILGDIDYAAHYSSPSVPGANVRSEDVLANPMGRFVDLSRAILKAPFLDQVITDTHFSQRNRQGRLLGFMARAVIDHPNDLKFNTIKAIAVDEGTAVCYGAEGIAKILGASQAFFLRGNAPIERIAEGSSLHWHGRGDAVRAYVIDANSGSGSFDLKSWTGTGGVLESWYIDGSSGTSVLGRSRRLLPPVMPR